MKILIFFSLFFVLSCNTYQVEKKEFSNTVFILFDPVDHLQKKTDRLNVNTMKTVYYDYFFLEENIYSLQNESLKLVYNEYENFDEMEKNNPVPFFTVHKSFLKKNKSKIITSKTMREIGYAKTSELIQNAKHIMLIDKSEIKHNKITVKKVKHFYIAEE